MSTGCSPTPDRASPRRGSRSEEHTSELQSRLHLVCRLLLEKKKTIAFAKQIWWGAIEITVPPVLKLAAKSPRPLWDCTELFHSSGLPPVQCGMQVDYASVS